MQVLFRQPYRPPKLGFIPPPPLLLERLGTSFPAPAESSVPNTNQSYVLQGPTADAIFLALGGAGLSYFAHFFPGVGEPIAMVGGLGLMGLGAYKLYNGVTGVNPPVIEDSSFPPDQTIGDVFKLTAKITAPINHTKIELTNRWALLFQSQKTVEVNLSVTNNGKKPITVQANFDTQEFTRPVFGQPDTAKFRTSWFIKSIEPGKTKDVKIWHPIDFLNTMFTSLDIAAKLVLRTHKDGPEAVFATTNFTAG